MKESETLYLYDPRQKNLYTEVLEGFQSKTCIFERNLLAYLEGPEDKVGTFYPKHLLTCPSCQKKAREYKEMIDALRSALPQCHPSPEISQMLSAEFKEILPLFKREEQRRVRSLRKLLKNSWREFLVNLFYSRESLRAIGVAFFFFVILQFIFN